MLRSSKEGRKQAARFHAFPHSANLSSQKRNSYPYNVVTSTTPKSGSFTSSASFGSGIQETVILPPTPTSPFPKTISRTPAPNTNNHMSSKNILLQRTAAAAAIPPAMTSSADSETESENSYRFSARREVPASEGNDVDENPAATSMRKRRRISSALSEEGSIDTFATHPDNASTLETSHRRSRSALISSVPFHPNKEKTPSEETTEDHSQSHSSPLSSPPTSHPDEPDDDYQLENWEDSSQKAMQDEDETMKFSNEQVQQRRDLESVTVRDREGTGERDKYHRFQPREVKGASLTSQKGKRIVVKSKKLVEAEETFSSTPASKRRALDMTNQSSSSRWSTPSIRNEYVIGESSKQGKVTTTAFQSDVPNKSFGVRAPSEVVNLQDRRGRGRPLGSTKEKIQEKKWNFGPEREETVDSILSPVSNYMEMGSSTDSLTRRRSMRFSETSQPRTTPPTQTTESIKPSLTVNGAAATPQVPRRLHRKKVPDAMTATKSSSGEDTNGKMLATSGISASEYDEKSIKPQRALWKRKVFLTSGLYSNDHKSEEAAKKLAHGRKAIQAAQEVLGRGTFRSRQASNVSALPPPTDYGRFLLEEPRDFRLSFPIWQEIDEIREKLEAKKKPPPYKHISHNSYFNRSKLPGEILICQCPADGDCGETCVNRQTEYLCHPKHCPCGDRCTNIYFGKRKAVKTEVQWYGARGFGLKTLEAIPKGGFIDEYRGEVIDFNEAVRRIRDHYKDTGNYYFLMYDAPAGEMLDGGLKGNITRFANHSCDPNCKVQKWLICGTDEQRSGEFQVALFAERDILAGEELTYDYGWSAFAAKAVSGESSHSTPEECHCGAINCSGFLGVKKSATAAAAATSASSLQSKLLKKAKKKKKRQRRNRMKILVDSKKIDVIDNKGVASNAPETSNNSRSVQPASEVIAGPSRTPLSASSPLRLSVSTPPRQRRRSSTNGLLHTFLDSVDSPISPLSSLSSLSSLSDEEGVDNLQSDVDYSPVKSTKFSNSLVRRPQSIGRSPLSSSDSAMVRKPKIDGMQDKPSHYLGDDRGRSSISSSSINSSVQPVIKKRLTVKDRMISVLIPIEPWKDEPLIVEGKRERKLSQKAAEEANEQYGSSQKQQEKKSRQSDSLRSNSSSSSIINKRKHSMTPLVDEIDTDQDDNDINDSENAPTNASFDTDFRDGIYMTSGRFKGKIKDPYHGLRNVKGKAFQIQDYPSGTSFYNRRGEPFDFNEYRKEAMHKKGKKPFVYTIEEYKRHAQGQSAAIE